jgi:FdhD protein
MGKSDEPLDAVRFVRADRFSTAGAGDAPAAEHVCVIEEAPVTIDVEGLENYTILCTPSDAEALAAGFLFSEGVVERLGDIGVIKPCEDDPNTIRVRLTRTIPRIGDPGRNLVITSSCGACGSESLKEQIDSLPRAGSSFNVPASVLRSVYDDLRSRQKLFEACGSAHAAAVFDKTGKILSFAEDVGRHNALDKAIGMCLLGGIEIAGHGAAVTSRLSLEMVGKCARAGIELVAAVSAPTSLAIEVAERCNMTLCAFVRESRATAFTHPLRVVDTRR